MQSALQEPLQPPLHIAPLAQWNEQLPPCESQPVPAQLQFAMPEHVQLAPEQAQPGPGHCVCEGALEPQPTRTTRDEATMER